MSKINFSTIDSPEIINLKPTDISPLMSSCEIKVLYLGENRNHSYISKDVALEMAKSIRGCPIVGYYKKDKEDFADHGDKITIDDEGIHFDCMTKPYGFVAPDAEVWFQKYAEENAFGETIEREYLVTNGFVWTEQFPETKTALGEGRPHSMEIDENSLNGSWQTNAAGMDFYIITDALFSKLCILGEDVEPCFEGSEIHKTYSLDDKTAMFANEDFKNTLYSMMKDLKQYMLKKGGELMDSEKKEQVNLEDFSKQDSIEAPVVTEFKKEDSKEEKSKEESSEKEEKKEDSSKKEEKKEDSSKKEEKSKEKDYSLIKEEYEKLEKQYSDLQNQFSLLEKENQDLKEFKLQIENEKKDKLIESFYMLSDEDKKDVIENKSKYSLDDIEAKLSIICFRNKVSFSKEDEKVENNPITTFEVQELDSDVPAFVKALRKTKNKNL